MSVVTFLFSSACLRLLRCLGTGAPALLALMAGIWALYLDSAALKIHTPPQCGELAPSGKPQPVCVCVCVTEIRREREFVCLCLRGRNRDRGHLPVCVCERQSTSICVYVFCICVYLYVIVTVIQRMCVSVLFSVTFVEDYKMTHPMYPTTSNYCRYQSLHLLWHKAQFTEKAQFTAGSEGLCVCVCVCVCQSLDCAP